MKYDYESAYLRDAKKLPDSVRLLLQDVVLSVREAKTLQNIPNLKKLSGYKNAYRIRIGEYRICPNFTPKRDISLFSIT
jgi:mRNA interferase RelE/StbE